MKSSLDYLSVPIRLVIYPFSRKNTHVLPPIGHSPEKVLSKIFKQSSAQHRTTDTLHLQETPASPSTTVSHCQCWIIQGIIKGRLYIVTFTPVEMEGVCLHTHPMISLPSNQAKVKAREFSGPGSLISKWERWSREKNTAQTTGPGYRETFGGVLRSPRVQLTSLLKTAPFSPPQGRLAETKLGCPVM